MLANGWRLSVKVGDLVALRQKKSQPAVVPRLGTIVEVWRSRGKITSIDIMFTEEGNETRRCYHPSLFKVISEV